jgi:glutathione synthase/RimK-type ligase-like ATP-grasp enzyme
LEVSPVANLAAGGRIDKYYESVPEAVRQWVAGIADAIGLRLLGVDAFMPDGLDHPDTALALDVNGSPTLTSIYRGGHRELALEIWRDIIERALKGMKRGPRT